MLCLITKTSNQGESNLSFEFKCVLKKKMTTFAFVRRTSTQNLKQPETQVSLFEPLDYNDDDELKKCDTASKDSWTSPTNTVQSEVCDEKNTSYIGLIYLKPVVGYSTTIYFHPTCRHQKENRYAISSLFYRN